MASSNNNIDSRGVRRGQCNLCRCTQFVKGRESACGTCNHVPGKHVNLDSKPGFAKESSPLRAPFQQQEGFQVGSHTQSYSYQQQQIPHNYLRHQASTSYSTVTVVAGGSNYYDNVKKDTCQAEGCNEDVFYDPYLGPFNYCSPKCRDDAELPRYNEKLRREVEKFRISGDTTNMMLSLPSVQQKETKLEEIVKFEIKPNEKSGFLFCEDKNFNQIVITGAESQGAIKLLKEGNVYLYDIVLKVMDIEIKDINEIEMIVKNKTQIDFVVKRHPYIHLDLSTSFAKYEFRKIVLIKYIPGTEIFGVRVESEDKKLGVDNDSIAFKSGLRSYEKLIYYAAATDTEVKEVMHALTFSNEKVTTDFCNYEDKNFHLLLTIV